MPVFQNILQAIGNVPLVRLNKVAGPDDASVYAKCEFMNPGGSVKDRMAMFILDKAEREGRLRPGGTIVENTSGNTGMGVALWAAVKGYRCVFTMPDKMSSEQVNALKRSEEHTSELQSQSNLVCRLLLEKKKTHSPARPA